MKCPVDDRDLVMSERQGIEIDYCPESARKKKRESFLSEIFEFGG